MKVNNKYTKILEIKVGSHLYGTNTPSSDIDYSGIVFPFETEVLDFAEVIESEFDKVYHSSNMQSKSNYNEIQNFVICILKNYFRNKEIL